MADPTEKKPDVELDAGSPHMDADDYKHMGIEAATMPTGEPNLALASAVRQQLEQHSRVDAGRIQVEVRGSTAVLTGIASDRHARGRAAELAAEVYGVESVINRIVVQPPEPDPGPNLTVREPGAVKEPSTQRS